MDNNPEITDNSHRSLGWVKLLIVLVPLLFLIGYYTYSSVSGATFFGITLRNNVDLENGLVGHWTFDGSDVTDKIYDRSTQGNHGGFDGGATTSAKVAGKIGQGLSFDGTNDLVKVPNAAVLQITGSLTISVWVKADAFTASDDDALIAKYAESNKGYEISDTVDNGVRQFVFCVSGTGSDDNCRYTTETVTVGQWYHVVGVYNTSGPTMDIYLNGTLNSGITYGAVPSSIFNSTSDFVIGSRDIGHAKPFDGQLDDVRIYNRAFSAKEIQALYNVGEGSKINVTETPDNLETGLVGHWTFDGSDMDWASTTAEASNRSGNNSGDVTNFTSSQVAIGKVGQALTFDGIDDFVSVPADASLDITSSLTLSTWAKLGRVTSNDERLALFLKNIPGNYYYRLEIFNSGGYTVLSFVPGGGGNPNLSSYVPFEVGTWYHITLTFDVDTDAATFYVDGVVVGTSTDEVVGGYGSGSGTLQLGSWNDENFFAGQLDDMRVYNRALSADEVEQLYSLGSGSTVKICKEASVQDADSNTYNTLAIGSQCWLDRNMDVGTRIAAASDQTDNSTIEKYCYDDTDANCTTNHPDKPDGGLYQWNEAMQYSTNEGVRGICPAGFHIPTDAEWHTLEKFLVDGGADCGADTTGYRCNPAGTKLQPGGRSGFEGGLSGYIYIGNSPVNRGSYGTWWTSSFYGGGNVFLRFVNSAQSGLNRGVDSETFGFSVRCLQD